MAVGTRIPRCYADTSVFGGCFDPGFEDWSRRFFDSVRNGSLRLLVSEVILRELERSPEAVRQVILEMPDDCIENIPISEESVVLRDEYIAAGVLGPRWIDDAAHVALATVGRADAIVSWNFRHLVRLDRIRQFNAVNLRLAYPLIEIRSQRELDNEPAED